MEVHLHTLCWNDRPMLDFFFRHYEPWVDRFFILDDASTDGTREYLEARPDVVLGSLTRVDPESWARSAQHVYDTAWKRSVGRADWVVVTNVDEHLHHPSMRAYLARLLETGVTAVPSLGYQMITDDFPRPDSVLWRDCPKGAPWRAMSKLGIFRPDRIRATNFSLGRHRASFEGDVVVYPKRDEVVNLHYKYLGVHWTQARHEAAGARLGVLDWKKGWGRKYGWSRKELSADFESYRSAMVDTTKVVHDVEHREKRWWRSGA